MEVISQRFVAANARGTAPALPATVPSPGAVTIPLRFMAAGIVSLLAGTIALVVRPDLLASYHYNQYIISLTHLLALGWILSICMGAVYQLIPVALETQLFSPRLARWQFAFHILGAGGMVWMFWIWKIPEAGFFGLILSVGILLFVLNIGKTLAQVAHWNVIASAIAASLVWLLFAVNAGLFLALDKISKFSPFDPIAQMHAHAHLGVAGFVLMLLVGASLKLIPMFALSEIQSRRRAAASVILLNLGLAAVIPALLLQSRWKFVFACLLASGVILYFWELKAILAARQRRTLDWSLRFFSTALHLLVPVCGIGLVLAWPGLRLTPWTGQLENAYGFLALLGMITMAVLGMLSKILPFLIWHRSYSRVIGRKKVPSLAQLSSPALHAASYSLYVTGVAVTTAAILLANAWAVRASVSLLAASIFLFAVNMALAFRHWIRPQIQPLPGTFPLA